MRIKNFTTLLLIIVTTLPATTFTSYAQEAAEEEVSIYVKALNQYARWVNKFEPETDTLYFEELRGITTLFPKEVDGLNIVILTGRNQRQVYTEHGGELVQRKMTPAKVVKSEIEIGIIPYRGRLEEQRGVVLSFNKWHAVIFAYNKKTERFDYNRFENR